MGQLGRRIDEFLLHVPNNRFDTLHSGIKVIIADAVKELDIICPNRDIAYLKRVNPLAGQLMEFLVKWFVEEGETSQC